MLTIKLTSDELALMLAALDQLPELTDQQAELHASLEKKLYEAKKSSVARPSGGIWAPRISHRDAEYRLAR